MSDTEEKKSMERLAKYHFFETLIVSQYSELFKYNFWVLDSEKRLCKLDGSAFDCYNSSTCIEGCSSNNMLCNRFLPYALYLHLNVAGIIESYNSDKNGHRVELFNRINEHLEYYKCNWITSTSPINDIGFPNELSVEAIDVFDHLDLMPSDSKVLDDSAMALFYKRERIAFFLNRYRVFFKEIHEQFLSPHKEYFNIEQEYFNLELIVMFVFFCGTRFEIRPVRNNVYSPFAHFIEKKINSDYDYIVNNHANPDFQESVSQRVKSIKNTIGYLCSFLDYCTKSSECPINENWHIDDSKPFDNFKIIRAIAGHISKWEDDCNAILSEIDALGNEKSHRDERKTLLSLHPLTKKGSPNCL